MLHAHVHSFLIPKPAGRTSISASISSNEKVLNFVLLEGSKSGD